MHTRLVDKSIKNDPLVIDSSIKVSKGAKITDKTHDTNHLPIASVNDPFWSAFLSTSILCVYEK